MTTTPGRAAASERPPVALDRARALARAIGETAEFRAFEAAREALDADAELSARLEALQLREAELRRARTWGGADPEEERAVEREWQDVARHPVLAAHFAAQEKLLGLLREVTAAISDAVGVDYGAACAPARGCC